MLRIYRAVFIALITIPFSVTATTLADIAGPHDRAWVSATNDAGFSTVLPAVDQQLLVGQIRNLRVLLRQRQQELTEFVASNSLGTTDAVITAIMPGGLIYAAYKKGKLERARTELAMITDEMAALARDLLVMNEQAGKLALARLR